MLTVSIKSESSYDKGEILEFKNSLQEDSKQISKKDLKDLLKLN